MKMKRYLLIIAIISLITIPLTAQETDTKQVENKAVEVKEIDQRALLAMTNSAYPVTPGDVYQVSYIQAGEAVQFNCMVTSDYSINLGFFGGISGEKNTFTELRERIRNKISRAYPDSYPDVTIISTGVFEVLLTGEIDKARMVKAWGLTRLADILEENKTAYTSERDIYVTHMDGSSANYDLYKAWYDGDFTQNPFVKPGSVIRFTQLDRQVTISGEVKRGGKYQLREEDTLEDLVEYYANNFTEEAYTDQLVLHRTISNSTESGSESVYLNYEKNLNFELNNLDNLIVRSKEIFIPVFFIEGAVDILDDTELSSSNTIALKFNPGTKLSTLLLQNEELLTVSSDLENSYYYSAEENKNIRINIAEILYEYKLENDIELHSKDRLIIPFKQLFVTVNGAVVKPGRYPYVPDKSYDYYINLAGGFDVFKNSRGVVSITDKNNKRKGVEEKIEQEDSITAETNNFTYVLDEYSSLISAVASISAVVISVINLVQ
ncbi:MAG: SLBB domain-containing protein [Spirochaetales bacterium]|uniref:SLBB domain-containing protein n=1 Tax=Candidatus Thalassospirochaeta sargassi TaxID=3119039 RepID=A0AAJ1MJI0_9SPIO|nr:SLBB domain-containing protein [Spirochaetales bacterium]